MTSGVSELVYYQHLSLESIFYFFFFFFFLFKLTKQILVYLNALWALRICPDEDKYFIMQLCDS